MLCTCYICVQRNNFFKSTSESLCSHIRQGLWSSLVLSCSDRQILHFILAFNPLSPLCASFVSRPSLLLHSSAEWWAYQVAKWVPIVLIWISVISLTGKYRKVIQCEWSPGLILTALCWTSSSFVSDAPQRDDVCLADRIVLVGSFASFTVPAVPLTRMTEMPLYDRHEEPD